MSEKTHDAVMELNGSGGVLLLDTGYSCGKANDGLHVVIESFIQSMPTRDGRNLYAIGGTISREDMKRLRDIIDEHLSKPEREHYAARLSRGES